jgi:cytochrome c6
MTKIMRLQIAFAAMVLLGGSMSYALDAAAAYKAKCAMCHGATGTPSPAMAKAMGIKPVSDPAVKSLTVAQIGAAIKDGKGKMKPMAGLSDAEIKAVAEYFKSLK